MKTIKDMTFGGERPLFESHNLRMENITISDGESAIKECTNLEADGCRFFGKYPWWHVDGSVITNCYFAPESRSAIWYSYNMTMRDCVIDGPKFFREMKNVELENVTINDADETFWNVENLKLKNVTLHDGTYPFMGCRNVEIDGLVTDSKYVFQYVKHAVIRNAKITTRAGRPKTSPSTTRCSTANILVGTRRTCASCAATLPVSSRCATPRTWCLKTAPSTPPATAPSNTAPCRPPSADTSRTSRTRQADTSWPTASAQ